MTASAADSSGIDMERIVAHSRRQALWPIGLVIAALAYLTYAWFAFDVPRLIESMRPERGMILALDSVAHKIHVTRSMGSGELEVALEGQRSGRYETDPDWVDRTDAGAVVDLGGGYVATIRGSTLVLATPDHPPITVRVAEDDEIVTEGPIPDWASANPRKFEARPTIMRRVQVTRTKIEVHRYFLGWENFLFASNSPLNGASMGEAVALAFSAERVDEDLPNWRFVLSEFWTNSEWQHGAIFIALLETVLMAVLGTLVASMIGLPLAFMAAANFNPSLAVRMVLRRIFDFLRGIDMLIWSLIFIRAFGLGPLTGIMAIAFTDTGTLGKLFSEAIENIDNRQVEGVQSTGASRVQRYRFGVVPQILPVFVSQTLYYLESNMRSATVIGALGAGGIGLKLVETLRTGRDWENTLYIVILTILVVFTLDMLSGRLRRALIHGSS